MKTTTPQFTTTPKVAKKHKTVMQRENITKPWLRAVEAFQERPPNPSKTPFPDSQTLPVDSRKQAATDLSYTMKATEESGKHRTLYKQATNHPAPWRRLFTADILQSPPPMGHADFAPQSRSAFKRRMSPRCTKAKKLPQVLGYLQYLLRLRF